MNGTALGLRNLLWVMAAFVLVALPHAARLPWWLTGLAATLLSWRAHLGHRRLPPPRKWLVSLLVAGILAAVYLHYHTLFGRDAGVALLIVMMALKTLESRSTRDCIILIFICYFIVVTNFFYSQTIPTAIYMLACVWIITAAMISLQYTPTAPPPLRQPLRSAAALLAQSVPLMLVLFLFFPRIQGPLWGLPQDAHAGVSGLSDTMSPGSLSSLGLSDAVAFRVVFSSPPPSPKQLYWRGPVLWDFDGRTWSAPRPAYGEPRVQPRTPPIEYEVTLEPHNRRWLFALELPAQPPPRARVTADFQLLADTPVIGRLRYAMTSHPDSGYGSAESGATLQRALRLPAGFNPRTLHLAQALRAQYADDRAVVDAALAIFRDQDFSYTLNPPLLGRDSVDEFLFDTRRGFCEHYTSAFAVLMRAAGIPARIVTGYQGGQINPLGDYMIVRQADAHAWTEVWLGGSGWVRVDPTAAVSPLRVEAGIAAAVPESDALPLMVRGGHEWLRRLRLNWDSLANGWNQWVLGYNPERQRRLLAHAGIDDASWRTLAAILVAASGLVTLALLGSLLRRLKAMPRDPAALAYGKFCARLGRCGLPRAAAEGPLAYAARLARLRPELAPAVAVITRLYVALRYGTANAADAAALDELRRRVGKFRA
ncbi:MAG: DUF3488 and DUF4129 domain-containing transglutaminase family protein [Burkholderiales bacterium]